MSELTQKLLSYFGTYTPGAEGAVSAFKFEYLTTLGFAAIVIFLGRAIVKHSNTLRKFAIPAPVAGQMGIILAVQAVLITLFGIFVSFNLFGRDYGAAVMTAGNCGWGAAPGPMPWPTRRPSWTSTAGTTLPGSFTPLSL